MVASPSSERQAVGRGVTTTEFNAVWESIQENPHILEACFPAELSDAQREGMYRMIGGLANNSAVISSVRARISAAELLSLESASLTSEGSESNQQMSPSLLWEQLKQKFPCVICQDLQAAPTILSCSHSFCGACLDELLCSCKCLDDMDTEETETGTWGVGTGGGGRTGLGHTGTKQPSVMHECPSCKQEIHTYTYERLLCADLLRMVDNVPDCEAKQLWKERRALFLHRGNYVGTQAGLKYGPRGAEGVEEEDGGDDVWETLSWVVPALTFAVLALISIVRALK
ncbi:hypothetical protein B484DRAFT_453956 [Ochromonadaceae sp. CCMP2298]|nr:hypothetical protein B484DRAFT_453956 [Ochromonadaceae sp. CCMP2298]